MSNYNELVAILKELLFNRFYPKPNFIRGLLGDGQGNVLVPGRVDYNYARFNRTATERFEVFNKEVSQPVDGLPILMGEYPWTPGLFQVVSVDWAAYVQTGWGDDWAGIQAHAPTHEWPDFQPGSDNINVYLRAMTPLRTQSAGSGSSSVYVTAYEYDGATGTSYQWPGVPPLALGAATPPTGSMRYMGVYLNPVTNTLGVVTGATTIYTDALEPSRPAWPRSVFPSAYVRLYGGQAGITERDIRDARRLWDTTTIFTGTVGLPLPIVTGSFLTSSAGTVAWTNPLDYTRVSKLYESDGGGPGWAVNSAGDLIAQAARVAEAAWYDFPLVDTTNASGVASHFKDNTSTYPAGWTESDAPPTVNTDDKYSFWLIGGNSTNTAWDYRRQTSINLESQAASAFTTFLVGPILIKDGRFTADLNYYFGIYRNNAGAIDTATYSRVRIWWDSANSLWKIIGEEQGGVGTPHSTTVTIHQDPLIPLYVAFTVQNAAAKATRQLFGASPVVGAMRTLTHSPTTPPTWGQMWVRFHQDRGAGLSDRLRIGALDYLGNVIE